MSKERLVDELLDDSSQAFDSRAAAEKTVTAVFDAVHRVVARGDTVQVRGFGTFEMKNRAGRTGRNPRTGEPINIAARKALVFRPAKKG